MRSPANLLLALLAVVTAANASQSLALSNSPNNQFGGILPSSNRYSAIGDWRIEGQGDNFVTGNAVCGLWELDSDAKVYISASNALVLNGFSNEAVAIPLGSTTAFRWVGQRNTTTGFYTLELWDQQTGAYTQAQTPISGQGTFDRRNRKFSIGSFYEPANPQIHLGFIRWFSTTRPLGGAPPAIVTGTPGDLMDYEFENSTSDVSGNHLQLSAQNGGAKYSATASFPPAANLGSIPLTVRAATGATLDASGSFSNSDSPNVTCLWAQTTASPALGHWRARNGCVASFAPPVFGTYYLSLTVTDSQGLSSQRQFKLGAVATDNNGVVVVSDPRVDLILGPMIRHGANPWSWTDNRLKTMADLQIALQSTTWLDYWNTASPHGALSVTNSSAVVTGAGTQFQSDFCGGAGNTTPAAATTGIVIWYNSAIYPGTTGRAFYSIKSCDSQTQLTLTAPYVHTGADTGLNYAIGNNAIAGNWLYSNTPGNYYDNVLAFYSMYYRTGIDDYQNAARSLASRWWTGPNWDRGKNFDINSLGGTFINAGPARGQSATGLILWALDTGTDIWPGMHYLWDYWTYVAYTYPKNFNWNVQMGNTREMGYMTAGFGLCALFDTSSVYRSNCMTYLSAEINQIWSALQINGTWQFTNPDVQFTASDGSVYATVTDGSPNITITGASWNAGTFSNDQGSLKQYLWFIKDPTNNNQYGSGPTRQNSDIGDALAYQVASVVDGNHAVLTRPYQSGSCANGCRKGLVVSHIAGFGTLPFMNGLSIGALGTYAYQAIKAAGSAADLSTLQNVITQGVTYLASTAYDPNGGSLGIAGGMFGARGYLNCEPQPNSDPFCASGVPVLGEAVRGFSAGYLITGDPAIKSAMDGMYQRMWCKPGFSCPFSNPAGVYMSDLDDGNYMLTSGPLTNKWFGFFGGYGFASSWPAARLGGVAQPDSRAVHLPVRFSSVANSASARITLVQPSGSRSSLTCVPSADCSSNVDVRQGDHLVQIDYLAADGSTLSPGALAVLPVTP
ncbi:MAG TPA: hypothetical protein VKB79_21225 [Bryobacteraceae bacterium]|nr:hypothetical protein [Bryobacteraceae bacterium]